jgi:hypothetical protein
MEGNENPFREFGDRCIPLSEVRELAAVLTCADFVTWSPLPTPHCQVYEPKVDVLVGYCPSLILLDSTSIPTTAEYCG